MALNILNTPCEIFYYKSGIAAKVYLSFLWKFSEKFFSRKIYFCRDKKKSAENKTFYRDVDKQRIPLYIEETHWFSLKQTKLHFMDCVCIKNSNNNIIHNDGKSFGLFFSILFCSVLFYALQLNIFIWFYNKPDSDDAMLKVAITKQHDTIW